MAGDDRIGLEGSWSGAGEEEAETGVDLVDLSACVCDCVCDEVLVLGVELVRRMPRADAKAWESREGPICWRWRAVPLGAGFIGGTAEEEVDTEAETSPPAAEALPSAWFAQPRAGGASASWWCGCRWSWRSGRTGAWGLSSAAGAAFSACEGELDMGRTSGAAERLRGRI